jgi:hypothetical protein
VSEQSHEATVAGDAAAAAVEELHAREAVIEAAEDAAVEATIAAGTAEAAVEEAEAAAETSGVAVVAAIEADQKADAAIDLGASAHEQLAGVREELSQIRPMLSDMYQDWQARKDAENAASQVEEVPVNERAANEAGKDNGAGNAPNQTSTTQGSSGASSTTSPEAGNSDAGNSGTRSHGLRRRRR